MQSSYTKMVVMGGGTGIHPVIIAGRKLPVKTTAIVAISDSGGSTGKLREIFNQPAVGDLRQSISGMSEPATQPWVEKLLEYRFEKGDGLKGHTVGNIILTALQEITGSTQEAATITRELLAIKGRVLPVSETNTQLEITYTDGSTAVGQHLLNESTPDAKKIDHIGFTTPPVLNPAAAQAIQQAELIVIGPGDYYDSILATLLVPGIKEAFAKTQARILYIINLMSSPTRTDGMTASEYVEGIEDAIGRQVMNIVSNSQLIPAPVKKYYADMNSFVITDDLGDDQRVLRAPLLSEELRPQNPVDVVTRSLLRHSSNKLINILKPLI
jgi:uncharacterized cofD-like protein